MSSGQLVSCTNDVIRGKEEKVGLVKKMMNGREVASSLKKDDRGGGSKIEN